MPRKISIIFFSLLLVLLSLLTAAKKGIFAAWRVDVQGQLIYETEGQVLGKPATAISPPSTPGASSPKQSEPPVEEEEHGTGEALPLQTQEQERVQERETIRFQEYKGKGYRVRLQHRNQEIVIKLEDEQGKEIEFPEGTKSAELEIEEPDNKKTVKVRSTGNAFTVIRNKIAAQTNFPLMVNLDTNELIVTTPAGQKVVTVLPDKAVENMLAANVLDQLGGKGGLRWLEYQEATPSATPAATPAPTPIATETAKAMEKEMIKLTATGDGTLAYEIPGIKIEKFFGLFKVQLKRTAVVSAETGELLRIRETLLERILDFFSF